MINTFAQFVGAYFKNIQPLSNVDIIGMCEKLKIKIFRGCFMRDEINSLKNNHDECFVMNTDNSSSSGTHWTAVNITGGKHFISIHTVLNQLWK